MNNRKYSAKMLGIFHLHNVYYILQCIFNTYVFMGI